MRIKIAGVAIAVLAAVVASGQSPAPTQTRNEAAYEGKPLDGGADAVRLFYLTHGETPQEVQEFVNLIRTMTDIRRLFPSAARRTIALRGTSEQIALAEWLFSRLDKPVDPQTAKPASYEFPVPGGEVDAVRVFYFPLEETPEDLQQFVNLVRTTTDVQRIFPYDARRAIALRGTPDQIALAEWFFSQLNKTLTSQANRTEAYAPPAPAGRNDAVRLFFFAGSETPQELQEILQMIRTTADIQRIFPYPAQRAIALRGTPAQIALAEWLFGQLGATPSRVK